jgi:hypothetical protein
MTQEEGNAIDGQIDQIIKARWLAIGLSETDLAEVLGLASRPNDDNGANETGTGRLVQIAAALDVPVDALVRRPGKTQQNDRELSSLPPFTALQSLLALRLLRAFHALTDQGTKEVVVQLAEQIVKRQTGGR